MMMARGCTTACGSRVSPPSNVAMRPSTAAIPIPIEAALQYGVPPSPAPPSPVRSKPPHYPEEAVAYQLGGRVLLTLKIDEHGDVVDVLPYQTSLDHRANSEQQAEHFRGVLEHASITAARNWHFDMTELVDGKATGAIAMVPIVFTVSQSGKPPPPNAWRAFAPGPIHVAPWANEQMVNADTLKEGSALALQSQFRLQEPVDGKLL